MSSDIDRRDFIKGSLYATAAMGGAMAAGAQESQPNVKRTLPTGNIAGMKVSRMLLGGNLLTHFTHSRYLRYVYTLAEHYNTKEKILETMALAEDNGINTLSIHTVDWSLELMREHRRRGGKIQWIVCPTAKVVEDMKEYSEACKKLVDDGCESIYLWGVHGDRLGGQKKVDLIAGAVEAAKKLGVPSGVGCHDLEVVKLCEENKVPCDFYIKTFHKHRYRHGFKIEKEEVKNPYQEIPGYWCSCPEETAEYMKNVKKPWIAFKIMAAGAIPAEEAFNYAFYEGADHILVGMFDYEIQKDIDIANKALEVAAKRARPWQS